jgi:hypothetical protein
MCILLTFRKETNATALYGRTLNVVARAKFPSWHIFIERAEIEVRYRLAGDWEAFERQCAQRRGR